MRFRFIEDHREVFHVQVMCSVLEHDPSIRIRMFLPGAAAI
jgi:hypothetical protein